MVNKLMIMNTLNSEVPDRRASEKSWGPFWSYQLDNTANPAHLQKKRAKWAKLAGLFSHGRLYRWTENTFPIFSYLKPVEISIKCFNIT